MSRRVYRTRLCEGACILAEVKEEREEEEEEEEEEEGG